MSDLISRSELLKEIEKYKFGAISNDAEREYIKKTILDFIVCQPTAYSVDKVVKELEKELEKGNIAIDFGEFRLFEIVKQGGVSDDACEWKSASDGEFIQNPHTKRIYSNEPSIKNVYCNTCGKKIKVVEQMTNADKIRNMTDEELFNLIGKIKFCGGLLATETSSKECVGCRLPFCCCGIADMNWLKSEAVK